MDKFQAMFIFTTVAKTGGFTAAASQLDMSPSAVTKNVAALEAALKVQLFNRTTRRVALTDIGQEFYERCAEILNSLDSVEAAMRDRNAVAQGQVRIVMPYSFGRVTFVPELPRFCQTYPGISLDVHFSDEPVDLIREGMDIAVLVRDLQDSRLIRRILHRGPELTVASPAYLARHGHPQIPADLTNHNCIIGNFGDQWQFQAPNGQDLSLFVKGSIALHNGDAMLEAAIAGIGIAKSTWWLFRKQLQAGTLVSILDSYAPPGRPISVLYPAKRYLPAKINTVLHFLTEITHPSLVPAPARALAVS